MTYLKKYLIHPIDFLIKEILIIIILLYQKTLSPYIGQACRFEPTCSNYALDCLKKKNVLKSVILIIYRLLRCNPFHSGGLDKV